MKRKRKRGSYLTLGQAIARLDKMTKQVVENIDIAIRTEKVLEAGNEIVIKEPERRFPGAESYTTISTSLAVVLAITLARLHDRGKRRVSPNKKDVASIPLVMHLLRQKRVKKALVARARRWTPHLPGFEESHARSCQEHIELACSVYRAQNQNGQYRRAIMLLTHFRNHRLAHSLMKDLEQGSPRYQDLFLLVDSARDLIGPLKLAVLGDNLDFEEVERFERGRAERFWRKALLGEEIDED